jgi:hypothetical protein
MEKMKKRYSVFVVSLFIGVLIGCSNGEGEESAQDNRAQEIGVESGSDIYEDSASTDSVEEVTPEEEANLIGEKVIRTASLEYETLEFQQSLRHLSNTVDEFGGYIEYSNESSYPPTSGYGENISQEYRQMDATIRVPAEELRAFLNALEGLEGYKVSEQVGSEDITQMYRDLEARIGVLVNKEERLNSLLEQAESIEDIIEIENSLSDTIQERESLQSQMDSYDHVIDYATVYFMLIERPRIASSRGEGLSFRERVQEALMNSIYAFYYWLQDLFIWLIYALPYLIVLAIIILIGWRVRKELKQKNKQ